MGEKNHQDMEGNDDYGEIKILGASFLNIFLRLGTIPSKLICIIMIL